MPVLRFLQRQVHARPLACFSALFTLGAVVARRYRLLLRPLAVTALALLILGAWLPRGRRRQASAALMLLAFVLGMARVTAALDAFPEVQPMYSAHMTGRIVSEPFINANGRKVAAFRLESLEGESSSLKVRLYLRGDENALAAVDYGQRLSVVGHIWTSDPVTNPYEFSFGDYLLRDGMPAYATAKIEDADILDTQVDLQGFIIRVRRSAARRIDALFPEDSALVRALLLGDRSLLSEETREVMNRTGIAHLISISGLHVTVLAGLLSWLLRRFMRRDRANLLAVALLVPYGIMIGFGAPFFRALVMFAVYCAAPPLGSYSDPVTRLSVAMLLYLLLRPLDIDDAGFVLSYAASAGILLLTPPLQRLFNVYALNRRKPSPNRFKRLARRVVLYLPLLLCASLAAQLATIPAVVASFGRQSVVSLPINLVCVPLCMLGYIGALSALIVSLFLPPLGALMTGIPRLLFAAMNAVAGVGANLPVTSVHLGRYGLILLIAHIALIVAASDLTKLSERMRRFLPLGLMLIALTASLVTWLRAMPFSVTFLDAEQADCAVLRSEGRTWLFDAGDTYTPAADYLNATCVRLDGIFLSHPHEDHAGGLTDVLNAFRPEVIYIPAGWYDQEEIAETILAGLDKARNMDIPIIELSAGDHLRLSPNTELTIWSPDPENPPSSANDLSLMALVSRDGQGVLFTGDISREGEPANLPRANVLKVAHHGSDKATSERFIEACQPEIAVISVGENNFGHPGEETLAQLDESGAEVYQTLRSGAVTLTWRQDGWRIDTYLEESDDLE